MDCVFRFLLATEVTAAESAMDSTLAILATLIGNYSWLLSLKSAYMVHNMVIHITDRRP